MCLTVYLILESHVDLLTLCKIGAAQIEEDGSCITPSSEHFPETCWYHLQGTCCYRTTIFYAPRPSYSSRQSWLAPVQDPQNADADAVTPAHKRKLPSSSLSALRTSLLRITEVPKRPSKPVPSETRRSRRLIMQPSVRARRRAGMIRREAARGRTPHACARRANPIRLLRRRTLRRKELITERL